MFNYEDFKDELVNILEDEFTYFYFLANENLKRLIYFWPESENDFLALNENGKILVKKIIANQINFSKEQMTNPQNITTQKIQSFSLGGYSETKTEIKNNLNKLIQQFPNINNQNLLIFDSLGFFDVAKNEDEKKRIIYDSKKFIKSNH